ncbi:GNAT family N-acetyltransferase [Paenibacillus sp. N3/727]|uniref:GNAT family N-acetyltransferase n=1 Tax=Paenibacillus sp. N3/727 TaxID=2925845 RepID=UPI001F53784A|nr:GNAT family N-acetyltransferase [Paenibacillus sp. N3/727]UNK16541.1 GNAT family N-acetyltransferase [Paenibacillus sp. N3/727]
MHLFRDLVIEDYEQILDLWRNTAGVVISESDSEPSIRAFLDRNQGLSFVCEDEGQIVGTALCGHDGRRGFLYHVAVKSSYRGQGIGSALVSSCLEQLKQRGILRCQCMVLADNTAGGRYWSAAGWNRRRDLLLYSRDT